MRDNVASMSKASQSRMGADVQTVTRDVWLAVHSSETPGAVALARGDRLVCRTLDAGQHASSLMGGIADVLASVGADSSRLRGIAVTRGPGSFTGIRIGLATAQGLALASGLEVAVCDSLEAEAAACTRPGWLAVVLDARRGEVYAGLYAVTTSRPRPVLSPFVAAPEEAAQRLLRALPESESLEISGSGAALIGVPEPLRSRVHLVERAPRQDLARALVLAAAEGQLPCCAPQQLEPLYLRKSDAELKRQSGIGSR